MSWTPRERVLAAFAHEEADRVIDILGRNGGYILNAVHNIQPEVPPENIVTMFEAAQNHPFKKAA